jgi:hypothetical protein
VCARLLAPTGESGKLRLVHLPRRAARVVSVTLFAVGCATAPSSPPSSPSPGSSPAATTTPTTSAAAGWDCGDVLVPPAGYEQETAFVAAAVADARQQAVDGARARLLSRLCDGRPCEGLAPHVTPWRTGQGGDQVCAMVVIDAAEVQRWRARQSLSDLDQQLAGAARALVDGLASPTVAIDKIEDGGVPGGERARWLEARMVTALGHAGARVVDVPADFSGVGLPAGTQALVSARTTMRREQGESIVEAIWEARVSTGRGPPTRRAAPPVTFLAVAAPPNPVVVDALPPSRPDLAIRVASHHAGGLCAGEQTQVKLTTTQTLQVRVFDLYGEDGAVLIFPNDERPDGRVVGGRTIDLGGPGGFAVVPVPDSSVERFLVVAAPTEAGLGAFASYRRACRVDPAIARALHRGQGLPGGALVASDGFRLLPEADCPGVKAPSPAERQALARALAELPPCP